MKRGTSFAAVLVTAPNVRTARALAKAALDKRLVACANLVPKIESHYWWKGKIEKSAEVLLLFKTTRKCLGALETLILEKHPYDTPEFIVLGLQCGTRRYLQWIESSIARQ